MKDNIKHSNITIVPTNILEKNNIIFKQMQNLVKKYIVPSCHKSNYFIFCFLICISSM
jgi:hypothetical protein